MGLPRQWWGEKPVGVAKSIEYARKNGLKVMVKPQIWNREQGWMGEFDLDSEADWKEWEQQYENYVLPLAQLSDSLEVELFCIGTEFRLAVQKRPKYWEQLITKIRAVYKGKLTYAANWDNYNKVKFWSQLDYIGIDAYFPLVDDATPNETDLLNAWEDPFSDILQLYEKHKKPVLFTEYGYRSIDRAAGKQYELEDDWHYKGKGNHVTQINAYKAIFQTFWTQPWFAGGFIWKWYPNHAEAGGNNNTDYTPQNKPVEQVIKEWYGK